MTLPTASYLVGIGQTGMPAEVEHHGPSNPIVDMVVVAVEPLCPGVHPARLGALRAMDDGHGVVLGGTYHDPDVDHLRPGVPLACAGTLR
jgi:hypothetical protein